MNHLITKALGLVSLATLVSCGVFSDSPSQKDTSTDLIPDITVSACAQTSDAAVQTSLSGANQAGLQSLLDMQSAMNDGSWGNVKTSSPTSALAQYNAILAANPSNCAAQFGKAVSSLATLVNNTEITDAMDEIGVTDSTGTAVSYANYLNTSEADLPAVLFKVSQATAAADPITITELQNSVATKILPVVDTAIALLTNVMAYDDFAFEFRVHPDSANEDTIQLDKGEVGPSLAALKSIKALLVVFVAVQAEASVGGTYDWVDTLTKIRNADFDHLTAGQTAALDQAVSLTAKNSPFLTIKSEWQSSYSGIPVLLKSAITDLQAGLAFGIAESKSSTNSQLHDPYIVGAGLDADVSPQELQDAIDNLTRVEKYLDGDVTIPYNGGKNTIVVNVPKFFSIVNGFQDYLPYHTINAYNTWNDTMGVDTSWYTYLYTGGSADQGIKQQINAEVLQGADSVVQLSTEYDANWNKMITATTANGITVSFNEPAASCAVTFTTSTGAAVNSTLHVCRTTATGVEYVDYIDVLIRGPFMFTNASGNPTFGENMLQEIDTLVQNQGFEALTNKVVFPDPTFGGVFPKLTNANVWTTLESLKTVKARVSCADSADSGLKYGECSDSGRVLPSNPSDLDVMSYYFN